MDQVAPWRHTGTVARRESVLLRWENIAVLQHVQKCTVYKNSINMNKHILDASRSSNTTVQVPSCKAMKTLLDGPFPRVQRKLRVHLEASLRSRTRAQYMAQNFQCLVEAAS